MSGYNPPQQQRAIETEELVIEAFINDLEQFGFVKTSLQRVASQAGITRPGLLNRFGSKYGLLMVVYNRYCEECILLLDRFSHEMQRFNSFDEFIVELYLQTEGMHKTHYAINLAMSQIFYSELAPADGTKKVFLKMLYTFNQYAKLNNIENFVEQPFAGVQTLISISLNYTLGAMPGLPRDQDERASLVSRMVAVACTNP